MSASVGISKVCIFNFPTLSTTFLAALHGESSLSKLIK